MHCCNRTFVFKVYVLSFMFCLLREVPWASCTPLETRHRRDDTRTHGSHRGSRSSSGSHHSNDDVDSQDIIRGRSKRAGIAPGASSLEQFWLDAQAEAESRRLLDAFGLKTIPRPRKRGETPVEAPAFMLELYRQLETSGTSGQTGSGAGPPGPRANTVRCFNEKGASWAGRNRFVFETTGVLSREAVLSAELRVFKKSARNLRQYSTQEQQITLQVYHVFNTVDRMKPRKRLVDEKNVNLTLNGWLQFNVTSAFHMTSFPDILITDDNNVKEFQIKIKNDNLNLKKEISFNKEPQKKRHQNRTPLLVLFLNDNAIAQKDIVLPSERGSGETTAGANPVEVLDTVEYKEDKVDQHVNSKRELSLSEYNNNYHLERRTDVVKRDTSLTSKGHRTDNNRLYANEAAADNTAVSLEADDRTRRRTKRAPNSRRANQRLGRNKCQLYDFYVDFQKVGWSDWIIAPNGYTANYCEGYCPFPLDPHFNATNHATVQAILHTRGFTRKGSRLPNPCCVPDKFESIHVLYLDDFNNVVLKEFDDMVATSCGCH